MFKKSLPYFKKELIKNASGLPSLGESLIKPGLRSATSASNPFRSKITTGIVNKTTRIGHAPGIA
jgi:hypothetical protein